MNSGREDRDAFSEVEIRAAERALEQALQSSDPTAWVYSYTEDAIFVAPGAPAVQGRERIASLERQVAALTEASAPAGEGANVPDRCGNR